MLDRLPPGREHVEFAASDVTTLLMRWSNGDSSARDQVVPIMYDVLRDLAHNRVRRAGADDSLNTTGLVHEAYLRLIEAPRVNLGSRAQFLGLASQIMRNILVDRARARATAKRGAGQQLVELDEALPVSDDVLDKVVELHEALTRLEALSPRQGLLLQHRYFGGLTLEESAMSIGVSLATAKRELRLARAWLAAQLDGEAFA